MSKRKGWEQLSPAYQKRLKRAGITNATYAHADLRKERGHTKKLPKELEEFRNPDTGEIYLQRLGDRLQDFLNGVSADWIPTDLTATNKATLAVIGTPPDRWQDAKLAWQGTQWWLYVKPRGGYGKVAAIFDNEDLKELITLFKYPHRFNIKNRKVWQKFQEKELDWDPTGSP